MTIISFSFIIFLCISVSIYYLTAKERRWTVLLLSSVIFFALACDYRLFLYLIFDTIVAFIGTKNIENIEDPKKKKKIFIITIFLIIGILITLKWINILPMTFNIFAKIFKINTTAGMLNIMAPLGVSYYTLSLIGYVTDVYRGAYKREDNFFKLLLFTSYYPILVSGPFVRYDSMKKELFEEKTFSYQNIYYGMERIIYGLMKKVVIADLLAIYVKEIFQNYHFYAGYFIIVGLILYAIQIYADFSGCMDIVLGASKMYGITLEENFKSPFMSKNLSEFWRRWHISLGTWGKDYIMYPLLKSNKFQVLGAKLKEKYGKKKAKLITTLTAILILWLFIGIWHGSSYRYIFCAGVLPWFYLTSGQIFEDRVKQFTEKHHINTECFSFELFRRLRTLGFMCFIWLFACANSLIDSLKVIKCLFVIPDSAYFQLLPKLPWFILLLTITIMFIVDYLKYKEINVYELFCKQNVLFKYFVLFAMIYIILMYGAYGPAFNASDFIYGGF